jgi:proliferating cell nuclear antigen
MLLKLDEPKIFSDAIAIISELVTEVRARASKSGLSIIAIDPANIALVMLKLPASAFSQFKVEEEEELGLNLSDLKAVLRRCSIGSSLVIEKQDNALVFNIQDKVKRTFSLALIDISSEEKQPPKLEFNSRIEIDSIALSDAIEDSAIVADACTLITSKKEDNFIIEAKGSLNSARTEFSSDEAKLQAQDAKAKYSLEYLQKFVKAARLSDKAVLQFSTDYPMQLDFKTKQLELGFVLAPRVETED